MDNNFQESSSQARGTVADSVGALAGRVQETVSQAQERFGEFQRDLVDKTKYAAESTDTFVREKPWNAVLAALGAGFVLGLIVGRR
jgi:ElaB/YqjD/DUF883 family membrane-anchored ribosome-binding protein